MKRTLLLVIMLICLSILSALRNWQVYTNTTYIFDMLQIDDKIFMATWGGLEVFDLSEDRFEKTVTSIDGLSSNDLRCIDFRSNIGELLLGSFGEGIIRMKDDSFDVPLNETLGLGSNYLKKIIHNDSLIIAITSVGVSIFTDDPAFPFPLLIKNISQENGLSSNEINDIAIGENLIFVASNEGIDYAELSALSNPAAWQNINTTNSDLPDKNISSLTIQDKRLAAATSNGILVIEDITTGFNGIVLEDGSSVYPVFWDSEQNLWYGFGIWNSNLLLLNNPSDIAIKKHSVDGNLETWQIGQAGLTTNLIKGFYEKDGQIFAYSWGQGFYKLHNGSWQNKKNNTIMANLVSDLKFDLNRKLWVANGYFGLEELGKGTKGVCSFDGSVWENYSNSQISLLNNNVLDIEVDNLNRKWFCSWQLINPGSGKITVYDEESNFWQNLTNLPSNYPADLFLDDQHRMWVSAIGLNYVLDAESFDLITSYYSYIDELSNSVKTFVDANRVFIGSYSNGLELWNDSSLPVTNGWAWQAAPSQHLNSGRIMDIAQRNIYGTTETWIASTSGLFMYNGLNWYRYGTNIKMYVWSNGEWFWSQNNPDPTYWYYVGQERLFSAQSTYPTCLFIDPFNRIWIGTADAGITIFDKERDTFTNITTAKSPLISDKITSFEYDELTGTLYIGTLEGLSTVEIGIDPEYNFQEKLNKVIAFPNPFYPENGEVIRIENTDSYTMPHGNAFCRIFDLNGELIVELEKNIYEQFSWDGTNKTGKKCGSGLYYYLISATNDQTARGKILLIR